MEDLVLRFLGLDAVSPIIKNIERELGGLEGAASGVGKKVTSGFNAAGDALLATGKIAGATTLGIGALAADFVKASGDLEFSLNRLVNDANAPAASLDALKKSFMALGPQVGVTANDIAKADYYVQSAGFHDVTENVAILKAGLQVARSTGADTNQTLYSLVTTLNALPGAFSSPQQAAATLQAIVASGVMTFKDLNQALKSGIFGTAQIAGQNIRDIGGLLDTLTSKGFQAPAAANTIRNILLEIPNNANNAKSASSKALAGIGIDQAQLAQVMTGPGGAIKALQMLQAAMHLKPGDALTPAMRSQDLEVLDKVFRGTRGAGQSGVMIEALQDIPSTLTGIDEAVSHFNENWAKTQSTFTMKMADFHASIYNLKVAIGDALLPTAKKWIDFLTEHVGTIVAWVQAHKDLIAQIIPVALRIGAMATIFLTLGGIASKVAAIFSSPLVLAFTAVAAGILILMGQTGALQSLFGNFSSDSGMGEFLSRIGAYIQGTLIPLFHRFADWFTGAPVAGIKMAMDTILAAFDKTGKGMSGGGLFDALGQFGDFFFLVALPKMAVFVAYLITTVIPAIVDGLRSAFVFLEPYLIRFANWFYQTGIPALETLINFVIGTVIPNFLVLGAEIIRLGGGFADLVQNISGWLSFLKPVFAWLEDHLHIVEFAIVTLLAAFAVGKILEFTAAILKLRDAFVATTLAEGTPAIVRGLRAMGDMAIWVGTQISALVLKLLEMAGLRTATVVAEVAPLGASLTQYGAASAETAAAAAMSTAGATAGGAMAAGGAAAAASMVAGATSASVILAGGSLFGASSGVLGIAGAAAVPRIAAGGLAGSAGAVGAGAGEIVEGTLLGSSASGTLGTAAAGGMTLGAGIATGGIILGVAFIADRLLFHFDEIHRGWDRTVDFFESKGKQWVSALKQNVQDMGDGFQRLMGDIEGLKDRFGNWAGSVIQQGAAAFSSSGPINAVRSFWEQHADEVQMILGKIGHLTSTGFGQIADNVGRAMNRMGTLTADGFTQMYNFMVPIVTKMKNLTAEGFGQIGDFLGPIFSKMGALTKDGFGQLYDTLKSGLSRAKDLTAQGFGQIWDAIKPGSKAADLTSTGFGQLFDFIKQEASNAFGYVKDQLGNTLSLLGGIAQGGFSIIGNTFQIGWDLLKFSITQPLAFIVGGFRIFWNLLSGIAGLALDLLAGNWGRAWQGIKNTVGQIFNDIKNLVGDRLGAIGDLFTSLGSHLATIGESIKNILVSPFKFAFNEIANLWNHTVGRISFTVPSWVPGLGGRGFSVPQIPTADTGGSVMESGLAIIHKGENVIPAGLVNAYNGGGQDRQASLLSTAVMILNEMHATMREQGVANMVPTASAPATTSTQNAQPIVGTEARVYALTNTVASQRRRGVRGEVL